MTASQGMGGGTTGPDFAAGAVAGTPDRWTREQLAAITTSGADVLVSASAGTGKTAVLVERVIRRMLDGPDPVDADRLLVVTFTEAAAAEMRERIYRTLLVRSASNPADVLVQRQLAVLPRAQISTIHSFCLALVREHFHELGLDPEIRVIDEHEAELLRLEVLDGLFEARYEAADEDFLDLVDRHGGDRGDEPLRRIVLELHAFLRGLPDLARWLESAVEALSPESGGFGRTAWGRELCAAVGTTARHAIRLLDSALERCAAERGPAEYRAVLVAERKAFSELEMAATAGDWAGLVSAARGPAKTRLPQSRGSDPASRELARSARDEAWKQLGRLRTVARPEEELLAELGEVRRPAETLAGLVIDLDAAARERRAARGLLDFADLEHYALRLLESPDGSVARKLRRRYAEVFVDEYQDINAVQDRILDLISRDNLFAIGDLKQSIYRFRGTDPGFFRRRRDESAELDPDGATGPRPRAATPARTGSTPARGEPVRWCISLARNFRSRRSVIDAVNLVFSELMRVELAETDYGPRERLEPGFDYRDAPDPDTPVELYILERADRSRATGENGGPGPEDGPDTPGEEEYAGDEIEREAELVARRILRMVGGTQGGPAEFSVFDTRERRYRPVSYRDIAVLLRVVQGRANRYLEIFGRLGVPVRANLSTGYFTAVEVETMLALLRVIDNPRQDIPLAAVLRSPVIGLDERELAAVRAYATDRPFFEAVQTAAGGMPPEIPAGLGGRLAAFLERLSSWRTTARRGPLSDLVWALLQETGYLGFVGGLPGGAQRQANLLALHDRAREFDRFARQGLARFLRFVEQLHENKSDLGAVGDPAGGPDAVLLTSVHKSKGLEFPVVFLADLGRQFRPRGGEDVLWHAELGLGPVLADRDRGYKYPTAAWHAIDSRLAREELAEEMRLLYVGMTRARERLVLSGSARSIGSRTAAWAATAASGSFVPETVLRTDRTYLDWLCRVVVRHPCGRVVLDAAAGGTQRPAPEMPAAGGQCSSSGSGTGPPVFHPVLVPQKTVLRDDLFPDPGTVPGREAAGGTGGDAPRVLTPEQWARIGALQPMGRTRPERLVEFDRAAGWRYPALARTRIPAKESVSRLSRRLARLSAAAEDADPVVGAGLPAAATAPEDRAATETGAGAGPPTPAGVSGFACPELRPWGGRRTPDPAELGTLVHEVLSGLDLRGPHDAGSLKEQGLAMERSGLLGEGEARLVSWEDLEWFFSTDLGRLVCRERARVRREVPFSLAVPAVEVLRRLQPGSMPDEEAGLGGELILVQGMIDLLIDLPAGPIILDFKTDRISAAGLDARTRAYSPQIHLYARAVRESLDVPVGGAWIVFLRARACRHVKFETDAL